ncbi:exodeoxyribonuclease III [Allohahella marinimesophila]|uniref:Exodeoxyribonuclease III n=1 Tax=Allohahella marinimesophila TaxID=1054972 RepID=A0ABP7PA60_9GAMM
MRVVTVSLNGLQRAIEAGFFDWIKGADADVICIQDHRMRVYELEDGPYRPDGYEGYFLDGENLEDGGVGIYTRQVPKAIMMGFAYPQADMRGAFLQADFDAVSVASFLLPDALTNPPLQDMKNDFLEAFTAHLNKTLRKRRQFLFCGNLQTAHLVTDADAIFHKTELSGFLGPERAMLDKIFDEMAYIDSFRAVEKGSSEFSWQPEACAMSKRKPGIRVDYQIASPGLAGTVETAWIDRTATFSDHFPVIVDYDIPY